MEKFKQLLKIKEIYSKGGNIIQYIKDSENRNSNSIEDILISYDFQAGSYIQGYYKNKEYKENYCKTLAGIIDNFGPGISLMEAGVGEATTLGILLQNLKYTPKIFMGFDISWSRLKFGKHFLEDNGITNGHLFTSDLFNIALPDNAIDVVYTSHSIEPNGGKEEEALKELYRVAKKYIVLLEPAYEFASKDAQERMIKHGYITQLHDTAKKLNYRILDYKLFEYSSNPLNPTGIMIIEKNGQIENSPKTSEEFSYSCPVSNTPLQKNGNNFYFSEISLLAYPILNDIPCLLKDNAILATHLSTDYETFKKENKIN